MRLFSNTLLAEKVRRAVEAASVGRCGAETAEAGQGGARWAKADVVPAERGGRIRIQLELG